jgi:type II secretion system protein N
VNPRLRRILPWVLYPLFYLFAFVVFVRLTFPYERIKDRVLATFSASQKQPGKRLEIDELGGYGIFGIEATGVRLITDPPGGQVPVTTTDTDKDAAGAKTDRPKPKVLAFDSVQVSVAVLRQLFGTMFVTYSAEIGGGEIEGTFLQDSERAEIDVEAQDVNVTGQSFLEDLAGLPLEGVLKGTARLTLPEGKMKSAEGTIDMSIESLAVGDGKAKIRDTIALPRLEAGNLNLNAEVVEGRLTLKELASQGKDFELNADGSMRLRDPFDGSIADLNVAFKFTDAYKTKNDITKGLFGDPGSKVPGLFDMDPKIRRARGEDGFYRWRVTGPFSHLNFRPASKGAAAPKPAAGGGEAPPAE